MDNQQIKIDYAVIPARGNSVRIKHKNIAPFLGRSMILRSIDTIKDIAENIIISSDSDMILNCVCKEFCNEEFENFVGLKTIGQFSFLKRDDSLSDNFTPTLPVITNALEKINASFDSLVCVLYPTAMFVTKNDILNATKLLLQALDRYEDVNYIISAHKNSGYYRSFSARNHYINSSSSYFQKRTQDLPLAYNDAGQFYIGPSNSFLNSYALLGLQSMIYDIGLCVDIDTMQDLQIAQAIHHIAMQNKNI